MPSCLTTELPFRIVGGLSTGGVYALIAYRPLRKRGAPRLAYLISAIGMSLFLSYLVQVWRGVNPETYPTTLRSGVALELGGVRVFNTDVIIILTALGMV